MGRAVVAVAAAATAARRMLWNATVIASAEAG